MKFLLGQKVVICNEEIGTVAISERKDMPNTNDEVWVFRDAHGFASRFDVINLKPYYGVSPLRRVRVMKNDLSSYVPCKGYTMIADYFGNFHAWGTQLFEQEQGSTNYSIALIEKDDGSIVMVYPELIQFVK